MPRRASQTQYSEAYEYESDDDIDDELDVESAEVARNESTSNMSDKTHLLSKVKLGIKEQLIMKRRWIRLGGIGLGLVVIGVVLLRYEENLSILTSTYVVMQIITTIGYGDFTVHRDSTKIFMAFYVLFCLLVVAYLMNEVFNELLKRHNKILKDSLVELETSVVEGLSAPDDSSQGPSTSGRIAKLRKLHEHVKKTFNTYNELVIAVASACFFIAIGTIFFATYEACTCSYGASRVPGCKETSHEMCVKTGGYVKTWATSFYMAIITCTTVGFGDHSPRSRLGRLFSIVWMFCGVAAMGNMVTRLSDFFFSEKTKRKLWLGTDFDEKIFQEMDTDNSGALTRAEYKNYFLVKHGLVSRGLLHQIDVNFDTLDLEGTNRVTLDQVKQRAQELARTKTAAQVRSTSSVFTG